MNKVYNIPDRQCGAALIVGLILMMVLTLLAISTMRTSTLELAMAGNAQHHQQAIQLAETGIQDAVNRINSRAQDLVVADNWQMRFSETVQTSSGDNLGRYDVTISFKEKGKPPANYSEDINALFFEIESTGRSAARNARSTFRQGFWVVE
ncbi:MAG TPA: pilus assembly PilX N-terminal domain-containing protein [Gammaproteobacteria bacterium]|jgi:hypothetical protein|nr:hypothetical protein [Chromatiales bacterium]MCP4926026.1 hypothetical protein [Gammaproteobacteria bacterium]MDP7660600.1 pilus assembly PilX N-terminal domain-containing protein [Gammaproteobacteria bacterium]HJP39327.1 pilus assembly PilX N-terminal domain-containing protein [Gammaproteobacteria bacterium]